MNKRYLFLKKVLEYAEYLQCSNSLDFINSQGFEDYINKNLTKRQYFIFLNIVEYIKNNK